MELLTVVRAIMSGIAGMVELDQIAEIKPTSAASWFVTFETAERVSAVQRGTVHLFTGPSWDAEAETHMALAVAATLEALNASAEPVDYQDAQRSADDRLFDVPFIRFEIPVWFNVPGGSQ